MENIYTIVLDKKIKTPIYKQLSDFFEELIAKKILQPDQKLPPIRMMAKYLRLNQDTIVAAYKDLEAKNIIKSKHGSGFFVKEQDILPNNDLLEECFNDMQNALVQLWHREKEKTFKKESNPFALKRLKEIDPDLHNKRYIYPIHQPKLWLASLDGAYQLKVHPLTSALQILYKLRITPFASSVDCLLKNYCFYLNYHFSFYLIATNNQEIFNKNAFPNNFNFYDKLLLEYLYIKIKK